MYDLHFHQFGSFFHNLFFKTNKIKAFIFIHEAMILQNINKAFVYIGQIWWYYYGGRITEEGNVDLRKHDHQV